MNILMIGGWIIGALATIFLSVIDGIAYWLLSVSYNIFSAVAQLDLFGGSDAGATLYNDITQRVYMILSIVMVFVFAYQLIMLIADPDGKAKDGTSHMVRDTLISIVLIIVLPLVYRYMALFQYHVLENNTIPAMIMGTNGSSSDNSPGKNIAMMVLISFYHPEGTTYNTFFDTDGKVSSNAVDDCKSEAESDDASDVCEEFVSELTIWENSTKGNGLRSLVWNSTLRNSISEGMDYTWILSTVAAIAAAWLFFSYALDLGVRAVKLGVLQLISPIPVILKIFPQTKKSFDKWFFQLKKTYLELFARIAVIFFALEIIKLVPSFIEIIFDANNNIDSGAFTKCVATVILILGILRFCNDAPKLFKEVFDTGGGLFSDINFKPGVKSRYDESVTNNKMLIGAANRVVPVVSGGVGQFLKAYGDNKNAHADGYSTNPLKAAAMALPSALRGISTGVKNKADVSSITFSSLRDASADSAMHTEEVLSSDERIRNLREARKNYLENSSSNATASENREALKNYVEGVKNANFNAERVWRQTKKDDVHDYFNALKGVGASISVDSDSVSKMQDYMKNLLDDSKVSSINDSIKSLEKKLKETPEGTAEYKKIQDSINDYKAERKTKFSQYVNSEKFDKIAREKLASSLESELKKNHSFSNAERRSQMEFINALKGGTVNGDTLALLLNNKKQVDELSKVLKFTQRLDSDAAAARKKSQTANNPPTSNNSGGSN